MSETIIVPTLGESITEATVAKWLKNVGDNVEADEPIVELETDKVNLEVPSPVRGVLGSIDANDGSVVKVGAILGSINQNGSPSIEKKRIIKNDYNEKIPKETEEIIKEAETVKEKIEINEPKKDDSLKIFNEDEE